VDQIVISGGAGQHDFVRQILADASGKPVVAPNSDEPVLLGSAILGAVAAGAFADVRQAMASLSGTARTYSPVEGPLAGIHSERYEAFKQLQNTSRQLRNC
jgi:D-ribulokinase